MNHTQYWRRITTWFVAVACLSIVAAACGIPTDVQPRNIDPALQTNLNKP
ncbi:MAG: hypothetical protein O3A24_00710 [Actinobacteria bacterium]|nr:hypothetical protein [Actinomycetota bacterium]MDA2951540.1 hypothetical protein [Actinomycetota bacterium]MDA2998572.1 hypothetical protein [Actinomycetota bacterium]